MSVSMIFIYNNKKCFLKSRLSYETYFQRIMCHCFKSQSRKYVTDEVIKAYGWMDANVEKIIKFDGATLEMDGIILRVV